MQPIKKGLSSSALHGIAMAAMLCDHVRIALFPTAEFLTCIGRISFPIYAFLLVEGFYYTDSKNSYLRRLVILALISEIPYNLLIGNSIFLISKQNVVWTLLVGFLAIYILELEKNKVTNPIWLLLSVFTGAWMVSFFFHVDYGFPGVLLILVFYFCRGYSTISKHMRTFLFIIIEVFLMGGMRFSEGYLHIYGQMFALIALIPIRAYNGRRGAHYSKRFHYLFYPLHLLFLYFLQV